MTLVALIGITLLVAVSSQTLSAELYVAPDGNDSNTGSRDKPLATLAGARDAVRVLRAKQPAQNITVYFVQGTYRLDRTVVFDLQDSAPEGFTTTYTAIAGQRPVFSAGVPVDGWKKLTDFPDGLPQAARGNVYVADMPAGISKCHALFDGGNRLPRARCKGFTPVCRGEEGKETEAGMYELAFPPGAMKKWGNLNDVELSIIPWAPWGMNVLPLESVDLDQGVARVGIRASYKLAKPMFGKFPDGSVFVENVFEGLDAPGRWVMDSKTRKIYLWPAKGKTSPGQEIVAPRLTELIRIEGKIDYEGPVDTPVRGLVFQGLTFVHGDSYVWRKDHQGWGLQHDWEMFDSPSAMVRLRGAQQCVVEACRFTATGSSAIRLDLHCMRNRIASNLIEHVGGVGVLLAGYGLGTKNVNRLNEIVNNHIHHVGETYWQSAGIFAWQSGENRIANNLIHNTPYTALVVSGRIGLDRSGEGECTRSIRWKEVDAFLGTGQNAKPDTWANREPLLHARKNLVQNNEIHDVMEVLEDGDGIYLSGAGGGNVVQHNYVHHCESVHMAEGIRCDDDQHETIIDGNVLFRIGGLSTCIAIKGVTTVTNNIMAFPTNAPYMGLLSLEHTPLTGSVIERNIFYAVHENDNAIKQGKTIYATEAWLRDTKADFNLYFNSASSSWGKTHLDNERPHGIESHSVAADPQFYDAPKGDLRLREDSPAWKLGFKPIDMKAIGLQSKVGPAAMEEKR